MRLSVAVLVIATLTACSSSHSAARPPDVARAEVNVTLRAPLMFGSSGVTQAAFDVTVRNPAAMPVRVRRIRLSTPAMMQYAIRPVERSFNDVLASGASKTFQILTEAVASSAGLDPSEPLNMRAEVDFEVGERRFREVYHDMRATVP